METQRLETIFQPPPLLPSSATSPSLAFFPLAFSFPFSPPFPPPHFPLLAYPCIPSHCCHHHHHLSLRQLTCPVAPCTAPSLHSTGDLGKGAEGRQEAHRDKPTGIQAAPRRDVQTEENLPDPHSFQVQKTLSPHHHNYAREVGGRSGEFPFPVP